MIVLCENVYKTFTHKSNKPDSFLYVPSSSVKTPLSSQVGNLVFIPTFNVVSSVWSIVFFLRASCCFAAVVKTRSIPSVDLGQPWNCLHILTTSGYVRFTYMSEQHEDKKSPQGHWGQTSVSRWKDNPDPLPDTDVVMYPGRVDKLKRCSRVEDLCE